MGNIVTLKDKDKQSIYPITHMSAVVDDNGNTVTELIDAEKTRAVGVEGTLDIKISAEADRAKQAEQTNANNISSEVQRATQAELDAIEKGRQLALRSLFVAAGAEYNDTDQIIKKTAPWGTEETWVKNADGTYTYSEVPAIVDHLPKHYYLNGLGDITEEEMVKIYNRTMPFNASDEWSNAYRINSSIDINVRTNIINVNFYSTCSVKSISAFTYNSGIEVIRLVGNNGVAYHTLFAPTSTGHAFQGAGCSCIIGTLSLKNDNDGLLYGGLFNNKIKHFNIHNVKKNLVCFTNAPSIWKKCIIFAIQNAVPTTAITITLHHDAYVRIANQPDVLEALTTKNAELASKGGSISLICATHPEEVTPNA